MSDADAEYISRLYAGEIWLVRACHRKQEDDYSSSNRLLISD